jgi:hypothetical protein
MSGALAITRLVGIARARSAARRSRAWRIWKIACASVTRPSRRRGSVAARPSPADCKASRPRRASTIVPMGRAATPFSGTKPGNGPACEKRALPGNLT